jgi:hypothetical protein
MGLDVLGQQSSQERAVSEQLAEIESILSAAGAQVCCVSSAARERVPVSRECAVPRFVALGQATVAQLASNRLLKS